MIERLIPWLKITGYSLLFDCMAAGVHLAGDRLWISNPTSVCLGFGRRIEPVEPFFRLVLHVKTIRQMSVWIKPGIAVLNFRSQVSNPEQEHRVVGEPFEFIEAVFNSWGIMLFRHGSIIKNPELWQFGFHRAGAMASTREFSTTKRGRPFSMLLAQPVSETSWLQELVHRA